MEESSSGERFYHSKFPMCGGFEDTDWTYDHHIDFELDADRMGEYLLHLNDNRVNCWCLAIKVLGKYDSLNAGNKKCRLHRSQQGWHDCGFQAPDVLLLWPFVTSTGYCCTDLPEVRSLTENVDTMSWSCVFALKEAPKESNIQVLWLGEPGGKLIP